MKKISVLKQALSIFTVHFVACLFTFLVMMPIIGAASSNKVISVCLSILMIVVYCTMLINSSYECAVSDHKSYSTLKPYPIKGLVLSLGALIPIIISGIYFTVSWKLAPIPEVVVEGSEIPVVTFWANMAYSFFTAPFWNVINIQGNSVSVAGRIISVTVPVIACVAGYYMGYIKLDYTKYFDKLMYDKKKK